MVFMPQRPASVHTRDVTSRLALARIGKSLKTLCKFYSRSLYKELVYIKY